MDKDRDRVKSVIDKLGSEVIQGLLGVSEFSIRHARRTGRFSAGWYGPLKVVCDDVGIECPLCLFNWKTPPSNSVGVVEEPS